MRRWGVVWVLSLAREGEARAGASVPRFRQSRQCNEEDCQCNSTATMSMALCGRDRLEEHMRGAWVVGGAIPWPVLSPIRRAIFHIVAGIVRIGGRIKGFCGAKSKGIQKRDDVANTRESAHTKESAHIFVHGRALARSMHPMRGCKYKAKTINVSTGHRVQIVCSSHPVTPPRVFVP